MLCIFCHCWQSSEGNVHLPFENTSCLMSLGWAFTTVLLFQPMWLWVVNVVGNHPTVLSLLEVVFWLQNFIWSFLTPFLDIGRNLLLRGVWKHSKKVESAFTVLFFLPENLNECNWWNINAFNHHCFWYHHSFALREWSFKPVQKKAWNILSDVGTH